jgi:thioester reductase-like protein
MNPSHSPQPKQPAAHDNHRIHAIETGRRTGALSVASLLDNAGSTRTRTTAPPAGPPTNEQWDLDRLSRTITEVANAFLPEPIDSDTDFFEAGATSVAAVELVGTLARDHAVLLDLDDVFVDARPRQLARRWLKARGLTTAPTPAETLDITPAVTAAASAPDDALSQLMADVARADSLPFVRPPAPIEPRRILITGATGFLGSHMLMDLLRHSTAHVVCLIRADDDAAALARLEQALRRFHLPWSREVARRVTAVAGDFRKPRLGLTAPRWAALAHEVDSIVNVGAAVDFLRGYPSLRQSNVLGPLTLAELAVTGPVKPLHHISSVAVFNELGIDSMGEDDPVAHIDNLGSGYDQTKWAAEAMLRRARDHGLVVTILRPGGIGGHPDTGAHNEHDFSSAFIAAHSHFGTLPAFRFLNVAGVDWVSRVAAAIVCDPKAWGSTYHLTGIPRSLDDAARDMSIVGMTPRLQHWAQWREDTLTRIRQEPVPQLEFLARMLQSPSASQLCEATLSAPAATCDRTLAFVASRGLPLPTPYDGAAQQKTFEALASAGLARLPERSVTPYVWFTETLEGTVTDTASGNPEPISLALTLSIESMYQLATERRVDVTGTIRCDALHSDPLDVVSGDLWIRPQDGVPLRHGMDHPLMRYRLELRDTTGRHWWLEGTKTAHAHRDLLHQVRTVTLAIGRPDSTVALTGQATVPLASYLPDQVDGLHANPNLSDRDRRKAKLLWFGWFQLQVGRGLLEPPLRVAMDLLDLRRIPTTTKGLAR